MPVNSTHPAYAAMLDKWRRCRDAIAGQDAVHDAGVTYLPMLSGQSAQDYDAYRLRALYYNASGRTADGLLGLIFNREPVVGAPGSMSYLVDDIDMAGTPVDTFLQQVAREVIAVSRVGILVDYPNTAPEVLTVGEASAAGRRPYLSLYRAESIINWRTAKLGGAQQLTMVVLAEEATVAADEFSDTHEPQYRVLDLAEGVYRVRIYRGDDLNAPVEEYIPLANGAPLAFIPFLILGPTGDEPDPGKPVMLDLVDVNLSHYRATADYEHALHFTALPTAVVTGHQIAEGEVLRIGSSEAWVFAEETARAMYLEYQGAGLSAIQQSLERKEGMMASLGARMLAPEKSGVEAENTAKIYRAGESSILASVANAISRSLTKVFGWARDWAGVSGTVSVKLNTEFFPTGIDAQELTALVGALQAGAISRQTFFDNLFRGGLISDGVTYDEEQARIDAAGPALGMMPAGVQGSDGNT